MKLTYIKGRKAIIGTAMLIAAASPAFALSGNVGADSVITEIGGLVAVAAAVVGAAILVVVVPWGAKMAVRAFKGIGGA